MQFKMHDRSLFAMLLRLPWWVSILIAVAIALVARLTLSDNYLLFGLTLAVPIFGVGVVAFVKQIRAPSATRVAETLAATQALPWRDFSAAIEAVFVRDGYGVTRLNLAASDFEVTQAGRIALVSCKRWKAASHGVGPLEELEALRKSRDAAEAIYISCGALTGKAQEFAVNAGMRVVNGADLALLLRGMVPRKDA